jgi:hypothetical protein
LCRFATQKNNLQMSKMIIVSFFVATLPGQC